ncbi:uncharacterized protein LOC113240204 [Hyposmocoma kahamanoa]|uniref:uncharacterized protein LOC113240204 n=1 Tax=Hyposmocoma kahamanoa TaxID=1477025 RepID=UPI000E6D964E|nr:uncharacterized protein LOC113240204 [Hyposmocoma kahamanoa]
MHLLDGVFLQELTIQNCSLYELPEHFNNLTEELIKLDLSHNYLRFVPFATKRKESSVFKNLETMDLSYNQLEDSASVMCTAALMPRLRDMILDYNFPLDICNSNYCNDQSTKPKEQLWMVFPELKNISASFTNTSRLCFGLMKSASLVVFNISYSNVSTLSLQELPAFTAPNFTMDLRENNITDIEFFDKNAYDAMNSRFAKHNTKTTVLANVKHLQCDCQYLWLQKTLNDISNLELQDIWFCNC